jgi:hypothetical protein
MKLNARLMLGAVMIAAACDSTAEPEVPTFGDRSDALVHNSIPYPQIDAQLQRLYTFNNCLTGIGAYYLPDPKCGSVDMTYEVASLANSSLAEVFPPGFAVDANAARAAMSNYVNLIDGAYSIGRVSCRARNALRAVADDLDQLFQDILAGRPLDLSVLPQPLDADLIDLGLLSGAGCPAETVVAPIPPAGGYSLFAINTSCLDGGRSIDISGDNFFTTQSSHSNASLRVQGTDDYLSGNNTYRCSSSIDQTAMFENDPIQVSGTRAAPLSFTTSNFNCTFSRSGNWNLNGNGSHWVGGNSNSRRLQPGVYCATGNITLSVDYVSGDVTLVANGNIDIGSDYVSFQASQHGIVAFANGNSNNAITFDGTAPSLVGHLYAPRGRRRCGGRRRRDRQLAIVHRKKRAGPDWVPPFFRGLPRLLSSWTRDAVRAAAKCCRSHTRV